MKTERDQKPVLALRSSVWIRQEIFVKSWECGYFNTGNFFQVLDQDLDLRTVKYSIWKSSGDIRLYYREVDPLPKAAAENGDSTKTDDSEDGKDEKQKEENQEDKTTSEEAVEAESGEGDREEEMETEEQLVAVMDGEEEEEADSDHEEKMEDNRTEDKS